MTDCYLNAQYSTETSQTIVQNNKYVYWRIDNGDTTVDAKYVKMIVNTHATDGSTFSGWPAFRVGVLVLSFSLISEHSD